MSEAASLLQVQRGFAAAVRSSAQQQSTLVLLDGDAARNAALLAVYRGNAVANAGKALGLSYPVVEKIVGEEFFSGLCRAFWTVSPSHSGDLNEYGSGFADFLASFPHVAELPYLPDVACVEWLVRRALQAADHVAVDIARLAEIAPAAISSLRFDLQPGLAVLSSAWPVASIWQQHQTGYTDEIDINLDTAECIAVHRRGWRVDVLRLSEGEGAFWQAALQGSPLETMLEAAFACDESFEVQAALQTGFALEFVTAFHIE
ncbi:MAG TPA: DNA-binding domain-containing protein [Rhodocyclaceae bacterium]|nr:DNA-binding domain-containing protein [Rhodocyclaceae bacterium]